jgi:hypothetical protein
MAWQNLLVVIASGVVLVGGAVLVLYIVSLRRGKAKALAQRDEALDVVARYKDREEIAAMGDEELHDEALALLGRYRPDGGGTS